MKKHPFFSGCKDISAGAKLLFIILVLAILGASGLWVRRTCLDGNHQNRKENFDRDVYLVESTIRRDLQETAAASIVVYPNADFPDAAPGMAMLSNRGIGNDIPAVTSRGTPLWQKIIYYFAEADKNRPGRGRLIRREGTVPALPSGATVVPDFIPAMAPHDPARTVILTDDLSLPESAAGESFSIKIFNEEGGEIPACRTGCSLVKVFVPLKGNRGNLPSMPPIAVRTGY